MVMIRGVLIDLSGTLHVGDAVIPGTLEALARLRADAPDLRVRFLTNTSAKSSPALREQLVNLKILLTDQVQLEDDTDDDKELVTSVLATRHYLQTHQPPLRPYCLMEDTSDLEGHVPLDPPHNCVVVGLAPSKFDYEHMNQAFRILLEHPNGLIAIHRAKYLRDSSDDGLSLGPGGFVTALETASGCAPAMVMGKPSAAFFASAMWDDVSPAHVCMIGDDVVQDLQGAADAGIGTRLLVQTGKYRAGDEINKVPTGVVTETVPSIVEAVEYIFKTNTNSDRAAVKNERASL